MSEIKNGGLDQYGAEPFEQQQFGTAGVEGVNNCSIHVGADKRKPRELERDLIVVCSRCIRIFFTSSDHKILLTDAK